MKRYSTPDVIISGRTVDGSGHRILKLNSYANEILCALKSGKTEAEAVLLLKTKYGLSTGVAKENVNLVIGVLRGESEGVKIEEKINADGKVVSSVSGFSMYPLLKNQRDTVTVEKISRKIKKYDVPLYRRNEKYILHRIIAVKDNGYIIRGDNCFFAETDIKDENILGIMTSFCRNGHIHTTNEFGYKLYSRIWVFIYPLRYVLRRLRTFASSFKHAVIKRLKH